MPIAGIAQPEILPVDEKIRLRKYDGVCDFAFAWYQDEETVYMVDGVKEPYTLEKLMRMYGYLDNHAEEYFIEVLVDGNYVPIGDASLSEEDITIVIGEKSYRGMGIGSKVIRTFIERARQLEWKDIYVREIYDWNSASQQCFRKNGFHGYKKTENGKSYVLEVNRPVLETKDLWLRKARQEDWRDMYYNLWRHSESAKYMLWNVTTSEKGAQERMRRTIAFEETNDWTWMVYEKKSDQAIGFAGLDKAEEKICGERGIAVGPAFTGKGYGKQILNALTDYARDALGAKIFVACCRTVNIASHHMQLSCGFEFFRQEDKIDPRTGEPYILEYSRKIL